VSPLTGKWRVRTVGVNVPVMIAGVRVQPGDLVIADEVGVCFVPHGRAAEVLATAQAITASEEKRLAAMASGISIAEFFSLSAKK
jgi:regulator of RNase E activity RraA